MTLACGGAIGDEDAADAGPGGDPDGATQLADAAPAPDATSASPGALLGTFQMTYYWVTTEAEFAGAADTNLYDSNCDVLATVPSEFASSLALEGTGRLLDGRMLNYWGSCSCPRSPCFFELASEFPWGVGVMNLPLEPFRSVAVDRDVISIGAGLYVAELDGLLMPGDAPTGGYVHDGCVVATDVGGGINGNHIDFFAALRDYYVELVGQVGSDNITLSAGGERCPGLAPAELTPDWYAGSYVYSD